MFFKKKRNNGIDVNEIATGVIKEKPVVSKIIGGNLYDTSKATHICDLCLDHREIPNFKPILCCIMGEDVSFYKGNTEYFIAYCGYIEPVTEEWVKDLLGQYKPKKYIELFGEPELA